MKTVVNVLHDAKFADGDWAQLALQLIDPTALTTIRANHPGDASHCLIDTVSQWLSTDLTASWEKLAEAVHKVKEYGEATAEIVRQKARIVHTCMFYVWYQCLQFVKCYSRDYPTIVCHIATPHNNALYSQPWPTFTVGRQSGF